MLAGQYPVHFAKSSCFDVLCHPLSLTFVSVEHIVCPATSTVTPTITCSGEGFCLSKRTWVEGRPLGVRTSRVLLGVLHNRSQDPLGVNVNGM